MVKIHKFEILVFTLLVSVVLGYSNSNQIGNVANGDELKDLIINNEDNIIVTVWYEHEENNDEHNKRNLITAGSVKNLLSKCHPRAIYSEADLSAYNSERRSFAQAAEEWNINTDELDEGPMVMVMYQQSGETFWVTYNTLIIKLGKISLLTFSPSS